MHTQEDIDRLAGQLEECQKVFIALGDENRLDMICQMLKYGSCSGMRVQEITECSRLSRPAVSHHLKILKDAGLLKMRREGTKNYYYFDPDQKQLDLLIQTLQRAREIAAELPDRSEVNSQS